LIVPVGFVPPESVAVSVSELPGIMEPAFASVVEMDGDAFLTVSFSHELVAALLAASPEYTASQ